MIVIAILLICCNCNQTASGTTNKLQHLADGYYGSLYKYVDGDNTVYVYEGQSGRASITVIK